MVIIMGKRKHPNHDQKVIPFPNLGRRLLEKGLEYLQDKQFQQAVPLFEEALQMNNGDKDTYLGLLIAYFEVGRLDEAKQLAKEMLETGIGDYFEILDLYMMILIQLHHYEELKLLLEVLFEEREIPFEKREHLSQILELSRKMTTSDEKSDRDYVEISEPITLFTGELDLNEQMLIVAKLANENIRQYIQEVKEYLLSEKGHPFIKTMLLNILKEQEYNQEITVSKLDRQWTGIPIELPSLQSHPFMNEMINTLSNQIESENPSLFEHAKQMVERCFFILYPLDIENDDPIVWSTAFQFVVSNYFGTDESIEDFAQSNEANLELVEQAVSLINRCEEISSPII